MERITNIRSPACEAAAHSLAHALENDPPGHYFLSTKYDGRPWNLISFSEQVEWYRDLLRQGLEEGAFVVTTNDRSIVAIWYPPEMGGIGDTEAAPLSPNESDGLHEFLTLANSTKSGYLRDREAWHLFLLARNPRAGRTCSASALICPFLDRARETRSPAWLEATTNHSRDVYLHLGFTVVKEFALGKGKADALGYLEDGGEGMTIWAMVWETL